VAGLIVVAIVLAIVGWVLSRRRSPAAIWAAEAGPLGAAGVGLHDTALSALLAAGTANDPARWSAAGAAADQVTASLQRLEVSAPDDPARLLARQAIDTVTALRSAIAVAEAAPSTSPLDEEAARTLRDRLNDASAALDAVTARARSQTP
jgi:hypothetical protein